VWELLTERISSSKPVLVVSGRKRARTSTLPALRTKLTLLALGKLAANLVRNFDAERRHELLDFPPALGAHNRVVVHKDQFFETMPALFAFIFIKRHGNLLVMPGANLLRN
jgi:hypothetical protein